MSAVGLDITKCASQVAKTNHRLSLIWEQASVPARGIASVPKPHTFSILSCCARAMGALATRFPSEAIFFEVLP